MATINLGAIKFNWKGAYNNSTAYAVDDVVSSGGNSYVCILASTGNAVSNGTYWNLMAQAGTNGTDGSDGTDVGTTLTTQGDILYRDGSGLQRLAKGTAGQVLKINSGATAPEWGNAGGGMIAMQVFTSSGTYTKNANTTKIKVTVTGAGGGGGSGSQNYNSLGGGGAGGTSIKFITTGIGSTETVTVGTGGTNGGAGASNSGGAGGTSSFGSHCSATGGYGGESGENPANYTSGVGSNGDINIGGGDSQGYQGGDISTDHAGGSLGGSSFWGGGGQAGNSSGTTAGSNGEAYGSGGGSGDGNTSSFGAGGSGKAGIVVIEEYA